MRFRGGELSAGLFQRRRCGRRRRSRRRPSLGGSRDPASRPDHENRAAIQHETCPPAGPHRGPKRPQPHTHNLATGAGLRAPLQVAWESVERGADWKLHPRDRRDHARCNVARRPLRQAASGRAPDPLRTARPRGPSAGAADPREASRPGPAGRPARGEYGRAPGRDAGSDPARGVGIWVTSPGAGPSEPPHLAPQRPLTPGRRRTYPAASLGFHPFGRGAAVEADRRRNVPCVPATRGFHASAALGVGFGRGPVLRVARDTPQDISSDEGPNPA